MRPIKLLLTVIVILYGLSMTGCTNTSSEMYLPTQEKYPFDRVIINTEWNGRNITGEIEMWEYVNVDTLLIRLTNGETFMTDKENVVFISENK